VDTELAAEKRLVQTGDNLKFGEEITTGDNSRLNIELYDGSEIRMGPNSKVVISEDMCDQRTMVDQVSGKLWYKVKKLLSEQKYEVKTEKCPGGVRGTEFSIELNNDEEIIRVFEGSFEVYALPNKSKKENFAKDMEQLTNDYKSGKISTEEFAKRSQEIMKNNDFNVEDMKNIMVTAGYMVRITDKISQPASFEVNENRWFDDANFIK
jgi:ferric-dicitrate binding protein FerR (iron transport regulator)